MKQIWTIIEKSFSETCDIIADAWKEHMAFNITAIVLEAGAALIGIITGVRNVRMLIPLAIRVCIYTICFGNTLIHNLKEARHL